MAIPVLALGAEPCVVYLHGNSTGSIGRVGEIGNMGDLLAGVGTEEENVDKVDLGELRTSAVP